MQSALGPRAAGDGVSEGAARSAGWLARLPVALVVVTLVALLVVPIIVSRRASALRGEMVGAVEPARLLVNDLELALAREAAALRGFIIDGQGRHLDEYREARVQEERALAGLRALVGRLDPVAGPQLARVEVLLDQWHERQEGVLAERMTPGEFLVTLPAQDEVYQDVLAATTRLRNTIIARAAEVRRESATIQRLGVALTAILVVMALVSILFVVRLGRRLERRGRELAESVARERFLSKAGNVLVGSLEYEETLRRTADLAVPSFADICLIDVVGADGEIRRIASTHPDPDIERLVRRLESFSPRPDDAHPIFEAMRTGRSRIIPGEALHVTGASAEQQGILAELSPQSIMLVPLVARGRAVGGVQFMTLHPGRNYGPQDLALAEDLAGRIALAIDNARLYQEARRAQAEAERRAREEQALREATAAVAGASTVAETTQRIAQSALLATGADGAFVMSIDAARGELEVVAVAGGRVPPVGARVPYAGSLAREAVERGEPRLVTRLSEIRSPLPAGLVDRCGDCAAAVIPLINRGQPLGALFLLRAAHRPFRPDELARAITFGDLAMLAIHKIHMLEESERRRGELVRLTESRSRLMRGFGHDVKNPLGAADGQLQLLEDEIAGELSPEVKEGVTRARRSIRSALELIEDLLELARREEAGQIEVERMPTDVRRAARRIADEYRAQAEAKGLTLQTDLPDELPVIESDAARIRQVLSNLLSNALKYTERGRIGVRVEVRGNGRAPGPGRWIAVDVWDTGPGIPEEQKNLLFREFTRLEPGTRRGAGVGLAISRGLARALGGDITVESEVGKGSTFTLWLPLDERQAAKQEEKAA